MAGERFTAKATLDLDARPFRRGIDQAGAGMKSLQDSASRAQSLISTAMAFTAGFGIITAIRQANSLWDNLIRNMEDRARKLQAAVGGGPIAQDFSARAARERGEAARPGALRVAGTGAQIFGGAIAGIALGLTGQEDAAREVDREVRRMVKSLKDASNQTADFAKGLDLLATQTRITRERTLAELRGMAPEAAEVGLGEELRTVIQAVINQGVTAAVSSAIRELRETQAGRFETLQLLGIEPGE